MFNPILVFIRKKFEEISRDVEILVIYAWAKAVYQSEFGAESYGRNMNTA